MSFQDEIVTGDITAMAFGGRGIIKRDGFVIFVPFTAIGDKVVCKIIKRKKNFAFAVLIEIIEPSINRITPLCPYFGTCGGCQLQHMNYQSQIQHKLNNVKEAFQRIGHLTLVQEPTIFPAQMQWMYRRHITLTLKSLQGYYQAGFVAIDNESLVPIKECVIFLDKNNPFLQQIQSFVSLLPSERDSDCAKLVVFKKDQDNFLLFFEFRNVPKNFSEEMTKAIRNFPHWTGVMVDFPTGTLTFGDINANMQVDGFTFFYSPKAFIQNHPEQSLNIYREVCNIAKLNEAKSVLDLFCGIGITTILLSQFTTFATGVEFIPEATSMAKKNAKHNNCLNTAFETGDVQKLLKGLLKKLSPDFVVVNPPRIGIDPNVILMLTNNPPRNIVYISCMASTLARDLALFCKDKYKIVSTQVFDMFPQTAHVETLVHLQAK